MTGLSENQLASYHRDGFLFVRELFSGEETALLGETARNDHALDQASSSRDDGQGNDVRLSLWNHPGD
ncbi:MAG: phytanoyl-CoA dioxygenase family protein, partial [Pirellulales bacterium]|nr:phytanoyl-CoA dioxygenase family protein [Pirellulales bacterium]